MEPTMTPAQLKSRIIKYCTDGLWYSGLDDDYGDYYSIKGGTRRILHIPFKKDESMGFNQVGMTGLSIGV
jgi:hypothetical protein